MGLKSLGDGRLCVDAMTFDAGWRAASPREFGLGVASRIRACAESGARVVLAPELLWLGLAQFGQTDCRAIARLFREEVWPEFAANLPPDCLVVAGTAPWYCQGRGQLRNRALILPEGYQDKLNLTEWETPTFSRGSGVRIFHFAGLQVAVLICLDIEVPELAVALRGRGIDLLLVPSATDSICGFERVNRCASARAVELGCAVVVAHLTGKGPIEMIDESVGATACYLPSQAGLERGRRAQIVPPEPVASGWITQRFEIDFGALRAARDCVGETNPARLHPASVDVVLP